MVKIFQYGSNTHDTRLINRIKQILGERFKEDSIVDNGKAVLTGWKPSWDLYSKSQDTTVMDIAEGDESDLVEGRVWELDEEAFQALNEIENGKNWRAGKGKYQEKEVEVRDLNGKVIDARTFIGKQERRKKNLPPPRQSYLKEVKDGLEQINASRNYIQGVINSSIPPQAEQIAIPRVYKNPPEANPDAICINQRYRQKLGVNIDDFVEVESETGKKVILRVRASPKRDISKEAVNLSEKSRRALGIEDSVGRDAGRPIYSGIKIRRYQQPYQTSDSRANLGSRTSVFLLIISILAGFFLVSRNLTGNVIGSSINVSAGICLIVLFLVLALFWLNHKKTHK